MRYEIEFKPHAVKDLQRLPKTAQRRILEKIEGLRRNLSGDVKRLTASTDEFRLRVGDYRILFELDGSVVVVYRVIHRKDAY